MLDHLEEAIDWHEQRIKYMQHCLEAYPADHEDPAFPTDDDEPENAGTASDEEVYLCSDDETVAEMYRELNNLKAELRMFIRKVQKKMKLYGEPPR